MSDVFRFSKSRVQYGSPFFTKFPPEIRRLIYREAFGDRRVHIVSKETRAPDTTSDDHTPQKDVSIPASHRWTHHVCIRDRPDRSAMAHPHDDDNDMSCRLATQILRTCKQALEEGIHLLYTSNVFAFDGGHSMSDFHGSFSPSSLIRNIEVYSNTMVLGNDDVKPMSRELDAMEEALKKRRTPIGLRIYFAVIRSPDFDPWEGQEDDLARRMGGLVALFVRGFLRVALRVGLCRLDIDLHHRLQDGYRDTLKCVVPRGLVDIAWFRYVGEEDGDEETGN
ncbi:hypothetical protein N0V84_010428 [Fusarium piperis]|uniref:DUF7730 domain-containing protein n=1 Tax=Fusarium piperis TaxID=1435070 RepID=A0A9W8TE33_9HYPO|nr:hypothetical protein N0V84_010428 [Fusarium piperis]